MTLTSASHRQTRASAALLNDWQRGFPLTTAPFARIAAALALQRGHRHRAIPGAARRRQPEPHRRRVRRRRRRRGHAGRAGGAARAARRGGRAGLGAARRQPQLRARTPLQPVVRDDRPRAPPPCSARWTRSRPSCGCRCCACRCSASTASTSASTSRGATGRSPQPTHRSAAPRAAARCRLAARRAGRGGPAAGAAPLRPVGAATRLRRPARARHAAPLAERRHAAALRRRRAPPRARLRRQRHDGVRRARRPGRRAAAPRWPATTGGDAGLPARARAAGWPYNLYCMVHGRKRDSVGTALDARGATPPGCPAAHARCCSRGGVSSKKVRSAFAHLDRQASHAMLTTTPLASTGGDARLLERLHGGFPLVDRPFAAGGRRTGLAAKTT